MKLTVSIAALLLLSTLTYSQQDRILFGVEGGISLARLTYDNPNIPSMEDWFESRVGFAAGLTFQYNFPKIISFRTGIMYERKGAAAEVTFTDNSGNVTGETVIRDNFNYLVVPLMLRATFGDKINFFLNAGPYAGILLKRTWTYGDDIRLPSGNLLEEVDLTKDTEDSEFGIAAGIGISTACNENIILSFEVRDHKGLTDVSPYNYEITTNSVLFLLGAAYKFGSKKNNEERK